MSDGQLFFSRVSKKYYWTGVRCCGCEDYLSGVAFHITHHPTGRRKPYVDVLCSECIGKQKRVDVLRACEVREVVICLVPPKQAFIVPLQRLELSDARTNLFDGARDSKLIRSSSGDLKINDKTRLARREGGSLEGVSIGKCPDSIALNDHVAGDGEVRDILSGRPVLEYNYKKLLEGGDE